MHFSDSKSKIILCDAQEEKHETKEGDRVHVTEQLPKHKDWRENKQTQPFKEISLMLNLKKRGILP